MGQSLSLSYTCADCSTAAHFPRPVKTVSLPPPIRRVPSATSPLDDDKSCSSFAISEECPSEECPSDDGSSDSEDLPFYHSESLGLSEYLRDVAEKDQIVPPVWSPAESPSDAEEEVEEDLWGCLFNEPEPVFHQLDEELAFLDAGDDLFEVPEKPWKPAPIDRRVFNDIKNLDLFQDMEIIVDIEKKCTLCGYSWTVLSPDFDGVPELTSFDDCPECAALNLDQELNQNYVVRECPICLDECCVDDVELPCTHTLHEECLKSIIEQKWTTDRINFNFLNCPCCRQPMQNPNDYYSKPNQFVRDQGIEQLKKEVDQLAVASLEQQKDEVIPPKEENADNKTFEEMSKDEKLTLAYNKLAFYKCTECSYPFFGGLVNCVADMEAQQEGPQERKCLNCSVGKSKAKCGCSLDNLIFKCMCCCHPATYHCGGTEFYCNSCHDDLYTAHPCPGPEKCPLGMVHPQNCVGTIGGGKAVTPFAIFCKTCGPLGHLWDCEAGRDMGALDKN